MNLSKHAKSSFVVAALVLLVGDTLPCTVAFLQSGSKNFRPNSHHMDDSVYSLQPRRSWNSRKTSFVCLRAASSGPGNVQRPENEFSRTYRPEKILGGGPRRTGYGITVEAEEKERKLLARRFELSYIDKLEAQLTLSREGQERRSQVVGVEVEGTILARVTQTCVRTSEDFDVDLEFPIFAVVRPVASLSDKDNIDVEGLQEEAAKSDRRGREKAQKSVRPTGNIGEMDVYELQRLLEDFDVEDDVVEDEAIYSMNGILDVGELVSQLFWLKLDPYPKKPGTGPIFSSISG